VEFSSLTKGDCPGIKISLEDGDSFRDADLTPETMTKVDLSQLGPLELGNLHYNRFASGSLKGYFVKWDGSKMNGKYCNFIVKFYDSNGSHVLLGPIPNGTGDMKGMISKDAIPANWQLFYVDVTH